MNKRKFHPTEKKIMRLLFQTEANLTIYEIASLAGLSYVTSKKYVERLCKEGILGAIEPQKPNKPPTYVFNFGLLEN